MPKKQTDLYLVVRGDSNDADFVTQITPITEEELKKFQPLIAAIKKFKKYKGMTDPTKHSGAPHEYSHDSNWPRGEYGCRQDLGEKTITELYGELAEEFDENYVPNGGENAGYSLHDIVEIVVMKLDRKIFTATNHYKGWAIF